MNQISEDGIIATFFAPLAGEGALELKDDAAVVVADPGQDLVVTVDALIAGVHFFPDDPPGSIARKALGVNLSDLAAKGARPRGYVLALALASDWTAGWLADFADGLRLASEASGCPLLGGDTVRTPGPLTVSITAFGQVPHGRMVARTGAKPGDKLYVSGTIGDAALGLELARTFRTDQAAEQSADALFLIDRYRHPQPRTGLADALRHSASGAMDLSDGLVGDATKMLRASGVTGVVDLPHVPLSPAARNRVAHDPALFETAVTGGDDYEILASVPSRNALAFEQAARAAGLVVTAIGDVHEGSGPPVFRDEAGHGVTFSRPSFSHF